MSAYYDQFLPAFETDARQHSVKLTVARVGTETEIDAAVGNLAAAPGGGLMVPPDAYTLVNRELIVQSTAYHRIPVIFLSASHQGRRPNVVRAGNVGHLPALGFVR